MQVSACLSIHRLADLQKRVDSHEHADHVEGTPTFDVNGKRLDEETARLAAR